MREALFIKKNKDRWLKNQQESSTDPDELAKDFTQLVDDLAYAKTFYPSGKVTNYLNKQASRIYLDIYKNRKEESNRLVTFWKYDLPLTIARHHRTMLFSFLFFLVFFAIGFFLSRNDINVTRSVLGDAYVEETISNIEKDNPFGIYESGNPVLSWLGIMINNIMFALRMFAFGLFCGIPALYLHAKTGVMVGVFNELFAAHGLGADFWLVVFVHGTLEITAIILTGGAALVLGKSFLFPGTLKRLEAFKQGAKDGVKIMIGLIPVFAVAAFFEGLFTRLYNDLSFFTSAITVLSAIFVIWYFIIYPIRLRKKIAPAIQEEEV